MRLLDGLELSGYIKERQLKQARSLRQSWKVFPKLAIVCTSSDPVVEVYTRLKCEYGNDILVDVDVFRPSDNDLMSQIDSLNNNESYHGIIVQLPLNDSDQTDDAIAAVSPSKDVDGLNNSEYIPATAMAIDWLMAGYNVSLSNKKIAVVGNGRLVGAPLAKLWTGAGLNVSVYDINTENLGKKIKTSDVVVSATGCAGLLKSEMLKQKAVVVDAGTAAEHGKIIGDASNDVRERKDLTITPAKGGIGPLTVAALFDNVLNAARKVADKKGQQDI